MDAPEIIVGLDIGTTTSLEKLGYTTNNDGEKITKKLLEDTLISNIEEILNRIPVEGAYKFEDFLWKNRKKILWKGIGY